MHVEQTQVQNERVERAMEKMGVRPGRKVCEAMRGLVKEAQHEIEEYDEKGQFSISSCRRHATH